MLKISESSPGYWEVHGTTELLLGGSSEDNLFQVPNVEEELDRLAECGGNYVRCTLSSRDPDDVWPFAGDLTAPNEEYFSRLDHFLAACSSRGIVAQVELWDRFDYARGPWLDNPYNPKNNSNYTSAESGLPESITTGPAEMENRFFRSVPALENNELILPFQIAHLKAVLDTTFGYNCVLYCVSNETQESPLWSAFWIDLIHEYARERDVSHPIYTTEMFWYPDFHHESHRYVLRDAVRHHFFEVSQNSANSGQLQWDTYTKVRELREELRGVKGQTCPLNAVKTYGNNASMYGTTRDGLERFWKAILAGCATARFHRPPGGLGLGEVAERSIRLLREIERRVPLIALDPVVERQRNSSKNEAYVSRAVDGSRIAFFPDGGDIFLELASAPVLEGRSVQVTWCDIWEGRLLHNEQLDTNDRREVHLVTPHVRGYFLALIQGAHA